jgi:two-component sensor histidine kinase
MAKRTAQADPQDRGLRISWSLAIVVIGCAIGGLALATTLWFAWTGVDQRSTQLSRNAIAVEDLRRIDDELGAWATKVDLVLGSGQTWFMPDIERAGAHLHTLLDRMEWDSTKKIRADLSSYIDREITRLHEAAIDFGEGRSDRLSEALTASDKEFGGLLERFHEADDKIQSALTQQRADLGVARATLRTTSWVATGIYLLFIAILWRWASKKITVPIRTLAKATRTSLQSGLPLAVDPVGLREVRMLIQSVMALTDRLESTVHARTASLKEMAELRMVILNTVPHPLAHVSMDHTLLTCNAACESFLGVKNSGDIIGLPINDLPLGQLLQAADGEHEVVDGEGRSRTVQVFTAMVTGEVGRVLCLVDVTDRVEHAMRLRSMLNELDHRVRNSLAAIQTLVGMEIGRLRPLGVDLSELSGRIKSMGRAHELLAIAQWSGVELRESIEIIVSPWAPEGEATIDGDNVRLSPEYAMPMCMMLNELVTNAVKHGALSVPTGTLRLAWTLKSGDLSLTWTEAGGPAIDGEPKSTGMGLNLIRGFVEHELGGSLTMNWLPEGLRVSMRFKLI